MVLRVRMLHLLRQRKFLPSRGRLVLRVSGRVNMTVGAFLTISTTTDTDGLMELTPLVQPIRPTTSRANCR